MARWKNERPEVGLLKFMYEVSELSCTQIAKMYGVTRQTVSLWLKDAGIPVRRRGRPGEKAAQIRQRRKEKESERA